MVEFAPAKINLGLNVIRKLENNFHQIETAIFPVDLNDVIEVFPSGNKTTLQILGKDVPGNTLDNTCMRVFNYLNKIKNLPNSEIILLKNIPAGSGLGGGSSDGIAFLKLLCKKFKISLTEREKSEIAIELGKDCSFFLKCIPSIAEGMGEKLTPIKNNQLLDKNILIIHPRIHISTKDAYKNVLPNDKKEGSIKNIIENVPLKEWKNLLHNDFEDFVFKRHLPIQDIKINLYKMGAIYSSLTGSGSAVYGIFDEEIEIPNNVFNKNYMLRWVKLYNNI